MNALSKGLELHFAVEEVIPFDPASTCLPHRPTCSNDFVGNNIVGNGFVVKNGFL